MPKIFDPFESAMQFVAQWEGGFSNDADDPGGATNYGITLQTLRDSGIDVDGDGDIDVDDIRKLTPDVAFQIYKNKYWNPFIDDNNPLPWAVAVVAFDAAVNCGVSRAKKWVADAMKTSNPVRAINEYRRTHYNNIIAKNPVLSKYRKGWNNRVNDLGRYVEILSDDLASGLIALRPF